MPSEEASSSGLLTSNGVPIDFRVSKGDSHDVNFLGYLEGTIKENGGGGILVLDSGFINQERLRRLVVAGVDFVCRARINMKGDILLDARKADRLRIDV